MSMCSGTDGIKEQRRWEKRESSSLAVASVFMSCAITALATSFSECSWQWSHILFGVFFVLFRTKLFHDDHVLLQNYKTSCTAKIEFVVGVFSWFLWIMAARKAASDIPQALSWLMVAFIVSTVAALAGLYGECMAGKTSRDSSAKSMRFVSLRRAICGPPRLCWVCMNLIYLGTYAIYRLCPALSQADETNARNIILLVVWIIICLFECKWITDTSKCFSSKKHDDAGRNETT